MTMVILFQGLDVVERHPISNLSQVMFTLICTGSVNSISPSVNFQWLLLCFFFFHDLEALMVKLKLCQQEVILGPFICSQTGKMVFSAHQLYQQGSRAEPQSRSVPNGGAGRAAAGICGVPDRAGITIHVPQPLRLSSCHLVCLLLEGQQMLLSKQNG